MLLNKLKNKDVQTIAFIESAEKYMNYGRGVKSIKCFH